jgi:Glycerophosphoryl diester phosphodiesterase family
VLLAAFIGVDETVVARPAELQCFAARQGRLQTHPPQSCPLRGRASRRGRRSEPRARFALLGDVVGGRTLLGGAGLALVLRGWGEARCVDMIAAGAFGMVIKAMEAEAQKHPSERNRRASVTNKCGFCRGTGNVLVNRRSLKELCNMRIRFGLGLCAVLATAACNDDQDTLAAGDSGTPTDSGAPTSMDAGVSIDSGAKPFLTLNGEQPLVIAHRGLPGLFPEKTQPAYAGAVDAGADSLEEDLHLSKDCVLVARHNPWLSDNTKVTEGLVQIRFAQALQPWRRPATSPQSARENRTTIASQDPADPPIEADLSGQSGCCSSDARGRTVA